MIELLLISFVFTCFIESSSGGVTIEPWQICVRDMHKYHVPVSRTEWKFLPNPCGFRNYTKSEISKLIFHDKGSILFAGDSTVVRGFIYAMNEFMGVPMPVSRVLNLPAVMKQEGNGGFMAFHRVLFMSQVGDQLCDILRNDKYFDNANRVTLYFSLGNYDLNWKLHLKLPMPHLGGPTQNPSVAKKYWIKFVNSSMHAFQKCLNDRLSKSNGKLTVVYREQWLPWCGASRFTNPKRSFRDCKGTIVSYIPWQRKILHPLLRHLKIPILPISHLFVNGSKYCGVGDGIHLDGPCKPIELQLLWNAVTLLRSVNAVQGNTEVLPDTRQLEGTDPWDEGITPFQDEDKTTAATTASPKNENTLQPLQTEPATQMTAAVTPPMNASSADPADSTTEPSIKSTFRGASEARRGHFFDEYKSTMFALAVFVVASGIITYLSR